MEKKDKYRDLCMLVNDLWNRSASVVPIRVVAKGGPGRAQAYPNVGCALPMKIEKNQYTLIKQSNILLK